MKNYLLYFHDEKYVSRLYKVPPIAGCQKVRHFDSPFKSTAFFSNLAFSQYYIFSGAGIPKTESPCLRTIPTAELNAKRASRVASSFSVPIGHS